MQDAAEEPGSGALTSSPPRALSSTASLLDALSETAPGGARPARVGVFAGMTTGYIFVGIFLEERDLKNAFGNSYEEYRWQVGMIFPWRRS